MGEPDHNVKNCEAIEVRGRRDWKIAGVLEGGEIPSHGSFWWEMDNVVNRSLLPSSMTLKLILNTVEYRNLELDD